MALIPCRFWIGIMIFLAASTNYMMRANMSVSVGEMAKPTISNKTAVCRPTHLLSPNKTAGSDQFDWSQNEQAQLIAAYFYGTMLTFFWGGTLAEIVGPVNVIVGTSFVTAILAAASPIISNTGGFAATFTVRFVTGMLGGPVYPAMNVMIARWAPLDELGRFLTTLIGNSFGIIATWLLVGFATSEWGWPAGFYSVAIVMGIFSLLFFIVCADSPEKHRWISKEEKDYIVFKQGGKVSLTRKKKMPPYSKIFGSIHFWAIVMAQFGNLWGLNLMLTFFPKYFKETLGFHLKASVGLSSIPYAARLFSSQVFGTVGDLMKRYEVMSLKNIRRVFVVFAHIIPAILFCFIKLAGCNWQAVLTLLTINQGLTGAAVVGHLINIQDLSPNFAGTMYGIMNLIGSTTGFIVPSIDGAVFTLYPDEPLLAASIIYIMGASVMIICGFFFMIFLSADVQPWNEIPEEPK